MPRLSNATLRSLPPGRPVDEDGRRRKVSDRRPAAFTDVLPSLYAHGARRSVEALARRTYP